MFGDFMVLEVIILVVLIFVIEYVDWVGCGSGFGGFDVDGVG